VLVLCSGLRVVEVVAQRRFGWLFSLGAAWLVKERAEPKKGNAQTIQVLNRGQAAFGSMGDLYIEELIRCE